MDPGMSIRSYRIFAKIAIEELHKFNVPDLNVQIARRLQEDEEIYKFFMLDFRQENGFDLLDPPEE
jgi:hypothetical protein